MIINQDDEIKKKYTDAQLINYGIGMPLVHLSVPKLDKIDKDELSYTNVVTFENPSKVYMDVGAISMFLGKEKPTLQLTMQPTDGIIQLRKGLVQVPMLNTIKKIQTEDTNILDLVNLINSVFVDATITGPIKIEIPSGGKLFSNLLQSVEFKINQDASKKMMEIMLQGLQEDIGRIVIANAFGGIIDSISQVVTNSIDNSLPNTISNVIPSISEGNMDLPDANIVDNIQPVIDTINDFLPSSGINLGSSNFVVGSAPTGNI